MSHTPRLSPAPSFARSRMIEALAPRLPISVHEAFLRITVLYRSRFFHQCGRTVRAWRRGRSDTPDSHSTKITPEWPYSSSFRPQRENRHMTHVSEVRSTTPYTEHTTKDARTNLVHPTHLTTLAHTTYHHTETGTITHRAGRSSAPPCAAHAARACLRLRAPPPSRERPAWRLPPHRAAPPRHERGALA